MRAIFILLFLIYYLALSFPNYGQEDFENWKKVKDKNGITLYERDSSSSSIKFYKGEMIVTAQLDDLEVFIKDIENYKKWMTSVDSSHFLQKKSDSVFIYRIVMQIPVLKNMEAIARFQILKNYNGKDIITESIGIKDFLPLNPDFKRIEIFCTSWQFQRLSEKKVKVNYRGMVDTYSNFIYFIIGRTIINNLYESFEGLRNCSISN